MNKTSCYFLFVDPRKEDQRIIQQKTKQLVDIVEQRNALVELLEEDRKRLEKQVLYWPRS